MDGRIKLYRKIDERGWRDKPNTFSLFIYLLTNANLEEKTYQGQIIRRGDCIVGRESLSEKLGISQQSIRTSINHLKSTSEITIKSTNKFSIITILRWEEYQSQEKNPPSKQPTHQQTTNQQLTTPKEYKNKEYKEITYTQEFEMFWKSYPKKKGKQKAMSIRKKIKESEYDMVIEGAKRYSDECKKQGTIPTYIKRPEGWLNDRRREDIEEDIEPDIHSKSHYEWYKRNINGTEFTDIDGTKKIYQDINYRRFLIYDRGIERTKAQELYEKARGEFIDLTF